MEPSVILTTEPKSKPSLSSAGKTSEKNDNADVAEDTLIADGFAALVTSKNDTPFVFSTFPMTTESKSTFNIETSALTAIDDSTTATPGRAIEHIFIPSTAEAILSQNALNPPAQPSPITQGLASPSLPNTNTVEIAHKAQITPVKVTLPLSSESNDILTTTSNRVALNDPSIPHASLEKITEHTNFPILSLPRDTIDTRNVFLQRIAVSTGEATNNMNLYVPTESTPSLPFQVAISSITTSTEAATITASHAIEAKIHNTLPAIPNQEMLQSGLSLQNIEIGETTPSTSITQQTQAPTPISPATTPQLTATGSTQPVIQQVVLAIQAQPQTSSGDIEIRLDPPELGNVRIKFNFDIQGQVQAHIFAESSDTTALLRRHMDILARELTGNGFDGADIQFTNNDEKPHHESDAQKRPSQTILSWEDDQSTLQVTSSSVQASYKNIGSLSHLNIIL